MNRIALVTTLESGKEADVRQAQSRMPTDELQQNGIHGIETFIGSGYYVLVLETENDDFQATMKRFLETPSVQGFLDKLRPHVRGLPQRGQSFAAGDDKHHEVPSTGQQRTAMATLTTADMPLAASSYRWSAGQGTTNTGLGGNGKSLHGGTSTP